MLNRYKVMRLLYWEPKRYQTLKNELNVEEKKLISALEQLLGHYDIIKKKIILDKKSHKYTHKYTLTNNGRDKLAFYEVRYRFHESWYPSLEKGKWQDQYVNAIAQYVRKEATFKFRK